jgi:ATP-dependent Clp protease ATP-binding subunit ClpC
VSYIFNKNSSRLVKARFAQYLSNFTQSLLILITTSLGIASILLFITKNIRLSEITGGSALILTSLILWIRGDINKLSPVPPLAGKSLDQIVDSKIASKITWPASPFDLWQICLKDWKASFILVRLNIHIELIEPYISKESANSDAVWDKALEIATQTNTSEIDSGLILCAILITEPKVKTVFDQLKLKMSDVIVTYNWLDRLLDTSRLDNPLYGGVGRDWAAGFTPTLDRLASNVSKEIQSGQHHFGSLTEGTVVEQIITTLSGGASGIALIGQPGSGKTSIVYAFAQRIIEGFGGNLAYKQVYSLNAGLLISSTKEPGDIERLLLTVLSEAIASGNIILALDEAQLFFGSGTGALDLGQLLLPLVQSKRLPLILAMSPSDWQKLIATYPTLSSNLTPITLTEPSQEQVIDILADSALGMEYKNQNITLYEALIESYRLSDRYVTEQANPGKAIKVLELAMSHPVGNRITAVSVQQAIEGSLGVKVAQAQGDESKLLLNLEDRIHERMINQTRAVSVVSGALRRSRAGVSNPTRPVGSFLFLGPTGVGKTELAKSLAAIYYGGETNMIRLDLSEYQQAEDVERLLKAGTPFLTDVRQKPFSVILLDEIEKAHPNLLNLLLQILDEGNLTDDSGRTVSFKDSIIIATSNAGADDIRKHIEAGEDLESFEQAFIDQLINSGKFKPELLNRFDEIVLFRPLNEAELAQVVLLLIAEVNKTISNQNIVVSLTKEAVEALVKQGYDPRLGARPMRRMVQRRVEDVIADRILKEQVHAGDHITLDVADINISQ